MPAYYPVFVDIRNRKCLVFGGHHEGERKVRYLLDCGGEVTLFSPDDDTSPGLVDLASEGKITWERRKYEPGDIAGAWIVIVADTSSQETNEAIEAESKERNVLCNVMDVTPLCNFIAPAIIHRQDVTVAVSTAGSSPALARRLRERMTDHDYCQCLRWADIGPMLADVRVEVRGRKLPVTPDDWAESITNQILEQFESGDKDGARAMLVSALEERASS
ncbi:MAG: bifunctional precorrin-2 dehydrogenase/sirohydrochlorin ferrochelatase [Dehalococcoidia bacterium]|nr:bifunctional precorrin-2 dehydrogenase/sirohydrochlorin ferrochelatase [Dehalococcoidia bacterium]